VARAALQRLHLRFVRTGGIFMGNRLETEVDADDLGESDAAIVRDTIARVDLQRLAGASGSGTGADEYQYDLTVQRGPDQVVHLRFDETRVPAELLPLVDVLVRRAEEQRRRS